MSISISRYLFGSQYYLTSTRLYATGEKTTTGKQTKKQSEKKETLLINKKEQQAKKEEKKKEKELQAKKEAAEKNKEIKKVAMEKPVEPLAKIGPFEGPDINSLYQQRMRYRWDRPASTFIKDPITEISKHKNIRKKAKLHSVFPDILYEPFTPRLLLEVLYPTIQVRKGHFIASNSVQEKPQIKFPAKPKDLFTLLFITPDDIFTGAKPGSVRNKSEFVHWLSVNIPGNAIDKGTEIYSYLPPFPVKGAPESQRYVYILFEQSKLIDLETIKSKLNTTAPDKQHFFHLRSNWCTNLFMEENYLKPIGMAFFISKWSNQVSELYKSWAIEEPVHPAPAITPSLLRAPLLKYKDITKLI